MVVVIEPTQNSAYIEDIDSTSGEAVVGSACVVWDVTVISDGGAAGVVTFHNGDDQTDAKLLEVKVAASGTQHLPLPRGKRFSTGLFVKSNVAGLDLAIDYD